MVKTVFLLLIIKQDCVRLNLIIYQSNKYIGHILSIYLYLSDLQICTTVGHILFQL